MEMVRNGTGVIFHQSIPRFKICIMDMNSLLPDRVKRGLGNHLEQTVSTRGFANKENPVRFPKYPYPTDT